MTTLQMNYAKYKEDQRHNLMSEKLTGEAQAETARANRAREDISWDSNSISRQLANETQRHNVASENETVRHNQATEATEREKNRINILSVLKTAQNNADKLALETERYGLDVRKQGYYEKVVAYEKYLDTLNYQLEVAKQSSSDARWRAELEQKQQELENRKLEFQQTYALAQSENTRENVKAYLDAIDQGLEWIGELNDYLS